MTLLSGHVSNTNVARAEGGASEGFPPGGSSASSFVVKEKGGRDTAYYVGIIDYLQT